MGTAQGEGDAAMTDVTDRIQASVDPDNAVQTAPGSTISALADLEAIRRKRLPQIPGKYRSLYLRAWGGKSRKAAIRAFCLECTGYDAAEVRRCTDGACPLYPYREDRP